MLRAFAVLTLTLALPAQERAEPVTRVFVFAGQSNMEGADTKASDIDEHPPFVGAGKPRPDILYWYMLGRPGPNHESKGWIPLGPDHHGRFGPELSFARAVAKKTYDRIAIIKSAWGGTTLAKDWDPDAPSDKRLFARTLDLVRRALADLKERGVPHRLEAFVWHQGENDMLDRDLMHGYGKRLEAFIARWRKELGAPELPWFVGEISDRGIWGLDHRRNMQIVRAQQRAVADADPKVWFVPTSHVPFAVMRSGQPHYHFGTAGQLGHGVAYANAYLKSVGSYGEPTGPLTPNYGLSPYGRAKKVRVFIVAGQRSAEGEGCYTSTKTFFRSRPDVPLHLRLSDGRFANMIPLAAGTTFGPELSLGWALSAAIAKEDKEKEMVAIIKVADGAAVLADWLPEPTDASRPQYAGATAFIKDALRLMGTTAEVSIEAVFWIPGEHDAWWGPFRKRYAKDLATFAAAWRRDLGAPKLRFLVAELADSMVWGKERLDELDAQIEKAAAADPLMWFVRTGGIAVPAGSVTFGTEGTLALGELLAKRYLEIRR